MGDTPHTTQSPIGPAYVVTFCNFVSQMFDKIQSHVYASTMNTIIKKIGTRELLRDIKNIKAAVKEGQTFEVYDRSTPLFRITPINTPQHKKYTFAHLADMQFSTAEPNLSQQVDEIVYG